MSAGAVDHYAALGLHSGASSSEVRRAYKLAARSSHPDKNPDGEDQFKRASAAYAVLSDDRSRREYDEGRRRRVAAPIRRPFCGAEDSHAAIRRARDAAAAGVPVSGYCLSPSERAEVEALLRRDREREKERAAKHAARPPDPPRFTPKQPAASLPLLEQMQRELAAREEQRAARQRQRERMREERQQREETHAAEMRRLDRQKDAAMRRAAEAAEGVTRPEMPAAAPAEVRRRPELPSATCGPLLVPADERIRALSPGSLRRLREELLAKLATVDAAHGAEGS
eukprot:TRINITY_DN6925_c5_g1_i1.p1 TRINITY_DN6925_c5_g1~~TRINITY_DN6925_c5_g1_i1.p1  ORF type:complete len:313 (+),score=124.78 TRINITY_DN6925_c5_g1_i1:89-940(+)